ncbi:hypothetical protein [Kordia sp.]|uniref:hypothetical protein n=1 Tax=Kordia sp. TaxID=1965332 RepID=UPI003D27F997
MSENVQNTPETSSKSNKDKEIDLGDLFTIIGNIFNKIFSFIKNVLLLIFDLLIKVLIIIRVHILKFAIVGVLSLVIGWFIDSRQETVYRSNIIVNANYGSARQLYSNISYYNNLAKEKDSVMLATIFGIDPSDANKIAGFYIEPHVTENDIIIAYDDFMKSTDTTIIKNYIDFGKFKSSIDPLEYKRHKISVASFQQGIFSALQEELVSYKIENNFIKKSKDIRLRTLTEEQKGLEKQLQSIDTLREVYNKSILSEAGKTSSAQTNIQMSASTIKTNEIELFALNEKISKEILKLKAEKDFGGETIEVLNDFSPGSEIKSFFDSFLFKIPIITLILLLLFIFLRELNSFLNTYEENKRLDA